MKKYLFFLFAIVSVATGAMAQADTIYLYHSESGILAEPDYTFDEIDGYLTASRLANVRDVYNLFDRTDINDAFWLKAIFRYAIWPQKAEEAWNRGEYYSPNCMIYVPDSSYIDAIIFALDDEGLKVAVVATDGLWISEQEIFEEKWIMFLDPFFTFFINLGED